MTTAGGHRRHVKGPTLRSWGSEATLDCKGRRSVFGESLATIRLGLALGDRAGVTPQASRRGAQ